MRLLHGFASGRRRLAADYDCDRDELLVYLHPEAVPSSDDAGRLAAVAVDHRVVLLVDRELGVLAMRIPSVSHLDEARLPAAG